MTVLGYRSIFLVTVQLYRCDRIWRHSYYHHPNIIFCPNNINNFIYDLL